MMGRSTHIRLRVRILDCGGLRR